MNLSAPPPDTVDVAARAAAVVELWLKIGGAFALTWGFLQKAWKPYVVWRREHQAKLIREVLKPELERLDAIAAREDGCAERMETVLHSLRELFGDHDSLVVLAMDNRERLDETNELLDHFGLSSDRRRPEQIAMLDAMIARLDARRKERKRRFDDPLGDIGEVA